jgi:hypothetical protein
MGVGAAVVGADWVSLVSLWEAPTRVYVSDAMYVGVGCCSELHERLGWYQCLCIV